MEASMSKGVFARKGKYKIGQRKQKKHNIYSKEPWYNAYKEALAFVENSTDTMNSKVSKQIYKDLHDFMYEIKTTKLDSNLKEIPTAVLLTGINLSDHALFFEKLMQNISSITPHMATLWLTNCYNVKNIMEEMVYQFMSRTNEGIRKSNCTFRTLNRWYQDQKTDEENNLPLVVILPDFEMVSEQVLHDLIYILSSYMGRMKFSLILGVATSVYMVQKSLTYDVTSKLRFKIFKTQEQLATLSSIMEDIVMSPENPFYVIGRPLRLLTDIFTYYDFSAQGFLQSYKVCMMKHFFELNTRCLCIKEEDVEEKISSLSRDEISEVTKCPSIEKHMENSKDGKKGNFAEAGIKDSLVEIVRNFRSYMRVFLTIVKCLHSIASTMPNEPLGKMLKDVYATAIDENFLESKDYKTVLRILNTSWKDEILSKLEDVISIAEDPTSFVPEDFVTNLNNFHDILESASVVSESFVLEEDEKKTPTPGKVSAVNPRIAFQQNLRSRSMMKTTSLYKKALEEFVNYLDKEVFSVHLRHPTQVPGWEIFCFNAKSQMNKHIVGPVKGAIFNALGNPCQYLECDCCRETYVRRTMPDICILYKLHLESSKLINVYDWLQQFLNTVNPTEECTEQLDVDPQMQARFTHAMSYLEYLGIIARSGRKKHHVKRLTSNSAQ